MKASELIIELQRLIEREGDKEVYCSGMDYPGSVQGVVTWERWSAYVPEGAFYVTAGPQ